MSLKLVVVIFMISQDIFPLLWGEFSVDYANFFLKSIYLTHQFSPPLLWNKTCMYHVPHPWPFPFPEWEIILTNLKCDKNAQKYDDHFNFK